MADPEFQRRSTSILRVAASYPDYFYNLIILENSAAPTSLQTSDSPPPPLTDAGALSRLPLELVHLVYRQLDIASLMRMRRLNRSARQTVDALSEYRLLTTYAVSALAAILKTGVARKATIAALYTVLCTAECSICGSFGGFLLVPTCSRYCFVCIQWPRRYLLVSMAEARKDADELRLEFPEIDARQSAIFYEEQLKEEYEYVWRPMMAFAMPYLDVSTGDVTMGVSCKGCQVNLERRPSGYFEYPKQRAQLYSPEGFLAHFKECTTAQEIWIESKEGTVTQP